ncbi:MAG: radical SAM family heme chaperone HemW [Candidatus Delongbacteria bacterium]|nr:radical SAM family heme chaperone HemW [Candidatus Delongbacteria bacterium]
MKCKHIYIHFPFCLSKCPYCDFFSLTEGDAAIYSGYVDLLLKEIDIYNEHIEDRISTLYFGGGTPGLMSEADLRRILAKFKYDADAEITVEVNPGAISAEKLRPFRDIGINRLSIGAQSFIDRDLQTIGRIHSSKDIYSTYHAARNSGFKNINLDLMTGIPGQTPASILFNAGEIVRLKPEHVSAYILTFYDETPFGSLLKKGQIRKYDDDLEMEFFELTQEVLLSHGYKRYEISNFAKEGYLSRHNKNTWDFGSYIGFGASAHSFYGRKRWNNPSSVEDYCDQINRLKDTTLETVEISDDDLKKEFVMLGLRKLDGIDLALYQKFFGSDLMSDQGCKIKPFISNGSLIINEHSLRMSQKDLNIFNTIVSEIIY